MIASREAGRIQNNQFRLFYRGVLDVYIRDAIILRRPPPRCRLGPPEAKTDLYQ